MTTCSVTGGPCECTSGCENAYLYDVGEEVRVRKDCQFAGRVGKVSARYYPSAFGKKARIYSVRLPGVDFPVCFRASELERI